MPEYEIKYLKLENGREPVIDWLNKLDFTSKKRVTQRILRISEGNFGDYKKIDNVLYELRFRFASGYRIYFTIKDNTIIFLLTAGDKSSQENDIKKAKEYIKLIEGILNA